MNRDGNIDPIAFLINVLTRCVLQTNKTPHSTAVPCVFIINSSGNQRLDCEIQFSVKPQQEE